MAFIIEDGTTISFAEYDDVYGRDQRLFENNEGLKEKYYPMYLMTTI